MRVKTLLKYVQLWTKWTFSLILVSYHIYHIQSILREIRMWANLVHVNVLPFLGYALEPRTRYPIIISEWMRNGSAWSYLQNNPKLPFAGIRNIVRFMSTLLLSLRGSLFSRFWTSPLGWPTCMNRVWYILTLNPWVSSDILNLLLFYSVDVLRITSLSRMRVEGLSQTLAVHVYSKQAKNLQNRLQQWKGRISIGHPS